MEKRKFKIDESLNNTDNNNDNKDIYTFVIPNSNIGELNIAAKQEKKKEKKTTKN